MNANEVLSAAHAYIEEHGWIQVKLGTCDGVCLDGALRAVVFGYPEALVSNLSPQEDLDAYIGARDALNSALGSFSPGEYVAWNDKKGRTKDDVLSLLRKAIV